MSSNKYNQVKPTSLSSRHRQQNSQNLQSHNNPSYNTQFAPTPQYAPPAPPPPVPKTQAAGLPKSLEVFVERCHQLASFRQFSSEQTAEMQTQLRELLQRADQQGKIWTNDWDAQSVPALEPGCALELVANLPNPLSLSSSSSSSSGSLHGRIGAIKPTKGKISKQDLDSMNSKSAKKARAQRFEKEINHRSSSPIGPSYHNHFDEEAFARNNKPLIGLSQTFLKNYFRLTSAPDPMNVRPLSILKKTLQILLKKYSEGEKYTYICDQFKSMRQDLRVQNIQEEFTVTVYETHAKIAIENGDLGEFNQCQTMLASLYSRPDIQGFNKLEFLSYKILYQLFTGNLDSIFRIRAELTTRDLENEHINMALKLFKCMTNMVNYHEFFRLYSLTIKTTKKLIDQFINKERIKSLAIICSAYNQLSLEFLLTELRFHDESDCLSFFKTYKLEQFMEARDEYVFLNTAKAKPLVLAFRDKEKKVDIKGQI